MNLRIVSRIVFAATFISLVGYKGGTFSPIWLPVPEGTPLKPLLPYICAFVAFACGAALLLRRTAAMAALVLFAYLTIWALLFKGPFVIRAPLVEGTYQSIGENAVQIAGAWILYVALANETNRARVDFLVGEKSLRLARILYGLALVAFGFSHFVYVSLTTPLVPGWLPGPPVFWAYLTGGIYLATGLSLLTSLAARWGSMVAAVQITLITLLVWGPFWVAGSMDASHWTETVVSWAIMAGAWVVTASYRGGPWIDWPQRRSGSVLTARH